MFRKAMAGICVVAVLSPLSSGLALANQGLPTWKTVFDPDPYISGEFHMVHSLAEYKGDLYAVAGDPWWGGSSAGQLFRSSDGETWAPAGEPGFGLGAVEDECGTNYYDTSWDLTVFQSQLYLLPNEACGTRPGVMLRSSDGQSWDSVVTTQELGLTWDYMGGVYFGQFRKFGVFEGMLYVNATFYDPVVEFVDAKVFRSPNGNPGTWEEVMNFPGWDGPGSFHVFKGALYLASDGVYSPPDWNPEPEQIWRTSDGSTWEKVVDGFGNPGSDGLGGFADYKGYLYVGVGNYEGDGGQIWRSKNGTQWEPVILDGFGNRLDEKVDGLVVYKGELYAYTVNWTEGGSVFRTSDARTWERANEPGWGNPTYAASHLSADQAVFKDELYMGVVGPQGVLLKMVHPNK